MSGPVGNRVTRFRKILEAAQSAPAYKTAMRSARLDNRETLQKIVSIEPVLARIGIFTLEQARTRPPRSLRTLVPFASPLPLAATPDLYWNSAGCAVLKVDPGSRPAYRALLIRTGIDEGLLTPMERDGLWERHGVPMFEHLIGMDGKLLAWECETHSGLHIIENNAIFTLYDGELLLTSLTDTAQPTIQVRTGWSASIEIEPCDCGRAGTRLMGLRNAPRPAPPQKRPGSLVVAAHG